MPGGWPKRPRLIDAVLPRQPIAKWGLSLRFSLRYLLAPRPEVVMQVLGIIHRAISGHLIHKSGLTRASDVTGAVILIQRLGSAFNLNVHFHLLVPDTVYRRDDGGRWLFVNVMAEGHRNLGRLSLSGLRGQELATQQARAPGPLRLKASGRHRAAGPDPGRARIKK